MSPQTTITQPDAPQSANRRYIGPRVNVALLCCIGAALIGGWMIGMRNAKQPRYQIVSMAQGEQLARLDVVTGAVALCVWQETKDSTSPVAALPKRADPLDVSARQVYLQNRVAFANTATRFKCGFTEPLQ